MPAWEEIRNISKRYGRANRDARNALEKRTGMEQEAFWGNSGKLWDYL